MFAKLHARLGDLWWYSAMIFIACRVGDVVQAFIGLWLVPKYVGQEELGAVIPLQQLCGLFTVPITILATVFSKYVNSYATNNKYGKVKSFFHDILITTTLIFLFCITVSYFVIPHFYDRLRISSGSLTILILTTGFIGNISLLLSNALQGFKQFKTITVINLISAPIRLLTLLIAMPYRALSGYILGQGTPSATSSLIAFFSIRKLLHDIPADTSWRHDIPSILRYLKPVAIYIFLCTLFTAITMTIYRQRLPEIESAAYYLISRFAETAGYIGFSMMVILFPLAAEAHEKGNENPKLLKKTLIAISVTTFILAVLFAFSGSSLFSLSNAWTPYLPFVHLLPMTTVIFGLSSMIVTVISYEMACRRFNIALTITGFNIPVILILASFTGYDFYREFLPDCIVDWMSTHNLSDLTRLTWFNLASALIQIAMIGLFFLKRRASSLRKSSFSRLDK